MDRTRYSDCLRDHDAECILRLATEEIETDRYYRGALPRRLPVFAIRAAELGFEDIAQELFDRAETLAREKGNVYSSARELYFLEQARQGAGTDEPIDLDTDAILRSLRNRLDEAFAAGYENNVNSVGAEILRVAFLFEEIGELTSANELVDIFAEEIAFIIQDELQTQTVRQVATHFISLGREDEAIQLLTDFEQDFLSRGRLRALDNLSAHHTIFYPGSKELFQYVLHDIDVVLPQDLRASYLKHYQNLYLEAFGHHSLPTLDSQGYGYLIMNFVDYLRHAVLLQRQGVPVFPIADEREFDFSTWNAQFECLSRPTLPCLADFFEYLRIGDGQLPSGESSEYALLVSDSLIYITADLAGEQDTARRARQRLLDGAAAFNTLVENGYGLLAMELSAAAGNLLEQTDDLEPDQYASHVSALYRLAQNQFEIGDKDGFLETAGVLLSLFDTVRDSLEHPWAIRVKFVYRELGIMLYLADEPDLAADLLRREAGALIFWRNRREELTNPASHDFDILEKLWSIGNAQSHMGFIEDAQVTLDAYVSILSELRPVEDFVIGRIGYQYWLSAGLLQLDLLRDTREPYDCTFSNPDCTPERSFSAPPGRTSPAWRYEMIFQRMNMVPQWMVEAE